MGLGEKLKEFGLRKFGSVSGFAEALKIKREQLYPYFTNDVSPGSDFLRKIKAMGCDINWLLSDEEGPPIIKEPSESYKIEQLEKENAELKEERDRLRAFGERISKLLDQAEIVPKGKRKK